MQPLPLAYLAAVPPVEAAEAVRLEYRHRRLGYGCMTTPLRRSDNHE